ncbi:MAG: hypothetical protein NVSMB52_06500 [Chloroflexota bacterium]
MIAYGYTVLTNGIQVMITFDSTMMPTRWIPPSIRIADGTEYVPEFATPLYNLIERTGGQS